MDSFAAFDGQGPDPVEVVLSMVSVDTETVSPVSIAGVTWSVTAVAGQRWTNEAPATLTLGEDMTFSIYGGCNRFAGQLRLSDAEIAFPEGFAGTLMACAEETEALERRFLEALRGVSRYARYGDGLVMTDARGQELLHFVARGE
jgi:putative lipoprotein